MLTTLAMLMASAAPSALDVGYEQRLIDWGLTQVDRELEPAPQGKVVEEVLVAMEDVFNRDDPYPVPLLNVFHACSKEFIVRREVLLQPGDTWEPARALEIERNLRRLFAFVVARVVAVKGKNGGVGILVITRDRWSLRLNSDFTAIGSLIQFLRLQPAEANFLGRNLQVALDFIMRLDTIALGQSFTEPRLFGSRVRFVENASMVLNRGTGKPEGTAGFVIVDRPYYSIAQPWGFATSFEWNVRRRRVFRGASVWQLPYPDEQSATATVPYEYNYRFLKFSSVVTKRWSGDYVFTMGGGAFGYSQLATPPASSNLGAEQAAWFTQNYLPRTESSGGLSARLHFFRPTYVVMRNLDAYELSEDYQLGPLLQAGANWALPLPFTSIAYVEVAAAARYRWRWGENLLSIQAAALARFISNGLPYNRRYSAEVQNISPFIEGGRLVVRVVGDIRQNDLNNPQVLLGGSTGLRGSKPESQVGRNYLLANVEYRTRSFRFLTAYVGLVLFYDVGSAFNDTPHFTHTAGMGLRIMLPQFNSEVLRIDIGAVIGGEVPSLSTLNTTFGQVTDLRPEPNNPTSSFLDSPL